MKIKNETPLIHVIKKSNEAGAPYTKWIASLDLRHKEHNNHP